MTGQSKLRELGYIIRRDERGLIWAHPQDEIEGERYFPTVEEAVADCYEYIEAQTSLPIDDEDSIDDVLDEEDDEDDE